MKRKSFEDFESYHFYKKRQITDKNHQAQTASKTGQPKGETTHLDMNNSNLCWKGVQPIFFRHIPL